MNLKNIKNVYLSGIGGSSMSGIALLLKSFNMNVSGSDSQSSSHTNDLINKGIRVDIGQVRENITKDIDLYIYSAAIAADNPERIACEELGIETVERGVFIGYLTSLYNFNIGISGTHGKTTNTGMIGCIFLASGMNPSIHLGTTLKQIGSNFHIGSEEIFIVEACEYSESYLNFNQNMILITNIDSDHLEYFGSLDNIKKSFRTYIDKLPVDGVVVINNDDSNSLDILDGFSKKVVTFGIDNKSDYTARNLKFYDSCGSFDLYHNETLLGNISLQVSGLHNVYNSLGSVALSLEYGLSFDTVKKGIEDFSGTDRRLEYKGLFNGAKVYDDYGHHPVEIDVTRKAVELMTYDKSWIIYEPLTYTRTKDHLIEFGEVLSKFDNIILIDIYASREKDIYNINSSMVADEVKKYNPNVVYINYEKVREYLIDKVTSNDVVIAMGPGRITKVIEELIK